MKRWLVACAVVAGCDEGVVIEVHAHPTVPTTEVELFLGVEPCYDCTAIKPDVAPIALEGDVYYRDDADVFVAKMVDGVARFRIEPGDQGKVLKTIVAVGLTADRQSAAALLPGVVLDRAQKWIVQLEPAVMQLRPPAGPSEGDFVHIWREQLDPKSACIVFERWHENMLDTRTFVVPKDDPDCDDFTDDTKECNKYAHDSSVPPALDKVSCLTQDNSGTGNGPCMLGGPTCIDGVGTTACGPSHYCVPDEMCTTCAGSTTTTQLRACFAQAYSNSLRPTPIVECTVPMMASQDNMNTLIPCPGKELVAGIFDVEFPGGCAGARLAVVPPNGMTSDEVLGLFAQSIVLSSGPMNALSVKAKLPVSGKSCTIPFEVTGTVDAQLSRTAPAAIELTAKFPDRPPNHLLLPLVITPKLGCAEAGQCHIEGDLSAAVLQCAR